MRANNKPELLSPAGDAKSLEAAISAGADAVYFGAKTLNARVGAENFSDDEAVAAVKRCRLFGVKTNVTVNTQVYDRELPRALELVGELLSAGADAFIVADLGLARMIKSRYPSAVLHASTQASGQNAYSASALEKLGFSRMVAPREISQNDLIHLCKTSPIETEIFVHGALCVSFSGQCLISSVIGGRSGNRGECAQPCRLPYACACKYPLSLKDMSLAGHITDILDIGVSSLKIEGRMKSPEYVFGVTKIYRRLIDEGRNATADEMKELSELFSRSGFTDGYFTEKIDSSMLGIRTEKQKRASAETNVTIHKKTVPVDIFGDFSNSPAIVTAKAAVGGKEYSATVLCLEADESFPALVEERLIDALKKLGGTDFSAGNIAAASGEGAKLPVSAINASRREALNALTEEITRTEAPVVGNMPAIAKSKSAPKKTAYFSFTESVGEAALEYLDMIFLPLGEYFKMPPRANVGIALPPVTFDGECEKIKANVEKARARGCRAALVTSFWQTEILSGFELFGDIRLNVNNAHSADVLRCAGINYVIASPESNLSRAECCEGAVMYGRLPLMTLNKCAIRDVVGIKTNDCRYCDTHAFTKLKDRTGAEFLLTREAPHRNVLYNSVPVYMCDKADEYKIHALGAHFIFTDEDADAVEKIIDMAKNKTTAKGKFKRI